jgi:hypothetical protein
MNLLGRRFCRCRRYCPNGNLVSKSTFYNHRKQQRFNEDFIDNSSDADDDDSDSDTESRSSWPRLSPPLAQWGPPHTPEFEGRRASPYPRGERPISHDSTVPESEIFQADPDRDVESDIDGGVQDAAGHTFDTAEQAGHTFDTAEQSTTPPRTASPISPPPPGTEDDTSDLAEIEEAIFSNFDIEDLLYAAHIEVEPWLKLGIVLLRWKSRKNVSTHAYNELRRELSVCLGMKVPSDRTIITHLQRITGLFPVKIDCCVNGCQAYVGRYRRAKRCSGCGHLRYQEDQQGDDDFPDINMEDSDKSDSEIYGDDLDENSQVGIYHLAYTQYSRSLRDWQQDRYADQNFT